MTRDTSFVVVLTLVVLCLGAYVSCVAPCSALGWMPVKDLPARCLRVRR